VNAGQVRVLLADDQELVRAGLDMLLAGDSGVSVVGQAADGLEAVRLAGELAPDVVLMDVRMPGVDGIEATRRIRSRATGSEAHGSEGHAGAAPVPRVVMLTTFDLDDYVFGAFRAGASGFLLKDAPRAQIIDAVRAAAAGDALVAPAITRRLIEHFVSPAAPRTPPPELGELTAREREVLELVGRGLSNGELADRRVLSEKTVKTHVGRIFAKLGLRDRVQAVIWTYEVGLVVPGEPPQSPPR
jgi:DNA-binding NarL/FixJ family response regulator